MAPGRLRAARRRYARPLRGFLVIVAVVLALGAAPAIAGAQTLRVTIPGTERQDCVTRPVAGSGVSRPSVTAPADGFVSARLDGPPRSDWDLALIAGGRGGRAGASPGGR